MEYGLLSTPEPHESLPFTVPSTDQRRQAVDVWRGFEYQLYQALNAWLKLPEGAILFLEVSEDHAIISGDQIEQTQVKDTKGSGSITLRTDAAISLIESHWRLGEANPGLQVASVLLTTAKAGKEANVSFPDDLCGLDYWRVAARDGTATHPLREFLLTLQLSEGLRQFVQEATDEQLKSRLIRPIKWICCSGELATIQQTVLDSLVCLGAQRGVPTMESERAADSLIAELKDVILNKGVRKITRADLLRAFEKATLVSIPRQLVHEGALLSSALPSSGGSIVASAVGIRSVGRMPLPPRVASRSELVMDMSGVAATKGILWLHGSSGLGKTTIALLMAQTDKDRWLFVDLRDCRGQELRQRLTTAAQRLAEPNVRGVILDDYPVEESGSTLLSLAQVTTEAHVLDVTVLVTSARVPTPSIVSRLCDNRVEVREVPYLAVEDVAALVADTGGDASTWAKVVHLFSGGGHPQLVDAKIMGLKSREWPSSEMLSDIAPGWNSKEISAEKDAVTVRLMKELPENSRELLYRLSLAMNGFDRRLAMAIAEAKEAVQRPGEAFTYLLGPWIESRGEDRYSLSPLVSGCAPSTISSSQQSAVRKSIVADLIQRNPFPGEQLSQLLLNACIEKDAAGMIWFSEAMFQTAISDWNTFRLLAQEVSVFTAFSTAEPLFAANNYVSTMLRIVQCFVALETDIDKVPLIFDQMIKECRELKDKRMSAGLLAFSVSKVLMRQVTSLKPEQWFPLVLEFPLLIKQTDNMTQTLAAAGQLGQPEWTIDQFLFVAQATSLPNIAALSDLMHSLDQLDIDKRAYYLEALDKDFRGRRLMVDNAWLNQVKRGELEGRKAAAQYEQIAVIARRWGASDLEIDCICAQAVMLDEYADLAADAIALLETAITDHGSDHRLLRRRQVVLLGQGQHEAALQSLPSITDGFSDNPIDLIYSLRDAGRSASEVGNFSEARKFFWDAALAADRVTPPMIPMTAGLLADCAVVAVQGNDYLDALNLMKQAVLKAEHLEADPTGLARYCLIILGHLGAWMMGRSEEVGGQRLEMKAGVCSNPNPNPEILERVAPTTLMLWYQLAIVEAKHGVDVGASQELRKRTEAGTNYLSLGSLLVHALVAADCKRVDVDAWLRDMPSYLAVMTVSMRRGRVHEEEVLSRSSEPLAPVRRDNWNDEKHFHPMADALIAFALHAIASDRAPSLDILINLLDGDFGAGTQTGILLNLMKADIDRFPTTEGLMPVGAACVSLFRNAIDGISPERTLGLTYYLWGWLRYCGFKTTIEDQVAQCMSSIWRRIITECRGTLASPAVTVPLIESVLDRQITGTAKLAALALAAESATASSFHETMRQELRDFVGVV